MHFSVTKRALDVQYIDVEYDFSKTEDVLVFRRPEISRAESLVNNPRGPKGGRQWAPPVFLPSFER